MLELVSMRRPPRARMRRPGAGMARRNGFRGIGGKSNRLLPGDVSGLTGHYDETTWTASAGDNTNWASKIGGATRDFAPRATFEPFKTGPTIGGKATGICKTALASLATATSMGTFFPGGVDGTAVIVMRPIAWWGNNAAVYVNHQYVGDVSQFFSVNAGAPDGSTAAVQGFHGYAWDGSEKRSATQSPKSLGFGPGLCVVFVRFNDVTDLVECKIDSGPWVTGPMTAGGLVSVAAAMFMGRGSISAGATESSPAQFCEMALYDKAISNAEADGLYNGLRSKWTAGFTSFLSTSADSFVDGTFIRASTGAIELDALRSDARGTLMLDRVFAGCRRITQDASIARLLIEESRVNRLIRSCEIDNAAWTKTGVTATANAGTGLDVFNKLDQVDFTASATDEYFQDVAGTSDNQQLQLSFYAYAAAPQTVRLRYTDRNGVATELSCAVTTTRQRFVLAVNSGTGVATPRFAVRNHTDAAARTIFAGAHALETGYWSTSPVLTLAAAATRALDDLRFASGAYPAGWLSAGTIWQLTPAMTSAQLVSSGALFYIYTLGSSSESLRVTHSGGNVFVQLVIGGAVVATSNNFTWTAGQTITITVKPSAGTIAIAGAATGNGTGSVGTPSTHASGQIMYVGTNAASGTSAYSGLIEREIQQAA